MLVVSRSIAREKITVKNGADDLIVSVKDTATNLRDSKPATTVTKRSMPTIIMSRTNVLDTTVGAQSPSPLLPPGPGSGRPLPLPFRSKAGCFPFTSLASNRGRYIFAHPSTAVEII